MDNNQDLEKIWETYTSALMSVCVGNETEIRALLDDLGERLIVAPSVDKDRDPGCHPGGLVKVSLDTAGVAVKLIGAYGLSKDIKPSLIKVCLLHDIGKVGDETHDYLIPNEVGWQREKGSLYKFNDDKHFAKMSTTHRTLYLLQKYGVKLTKEEWIAIQISSGQYIEENRFYLYAEPPIGLILQQAKYYVLRRERYL